MTAEQFWEGDPRIASAYRRKHWLDIEAENQKLWMQGLYNFHALSVSIANAMRSRGKKAESYMAEPLKILPETELERKKRIADERKKTVDALTKWAQNWNKNHQGR